MPGGNTVMDSIKLFLEQQPLFSMFLVIGLGYALGGVNMRSKKSVLAVKDVV
jgi:hypothetical protein